MAPPKIGNPLAVPIPSPLLLINYPILATNVRVLCEKDFSRGRSGQSSLAATIQSLRLTYQLEGFVGLYRGAHLYLLHQAVRDSLRFSTDRCMGLVERTFRATRGTDQGPEGATEAETDEARADDGAVSLVFYRLRMAAKYLIDALCYPILLASTRGIVLRKDPLNTWQRVRFWCREEGVLSLFNGLTSSLLSTACDEAMDMVLASCIERCSVGVEVDMAEKLLLKASGSQLVSIFTAPINYVGVIQRCQSHISGLLEPKPLGTTVWNLPWRGSFYQFLMFGGILALNVRLIQWKIEIQADEDSD